MSPDCSHGKVPQTLSCMVEKGPTPVSDDTKNITLLATQCSSANCRGLQNRKLLAIDHQEVLQRSGSSWRGNATVQLVSNLWHGILSSFQFPRDDSIHLTAFPNSKRSVNLSHPVLSSVTTLKHIMCFSIYHLSGKVSLYISDDVKYLHYFRFAQVTVAESHLGHSILLHLC